MMGKPSARILYLGTLLFVLVFALTLRLLWRDVQQRMEVARAQSTYQLVQGYLPNRPTDTPGAIAWLHAQLQTYLSKTLHMGELMQRRDQLQVPALFSSYAELLQQIPATGASGDPLPLQRLPLDPQPPSDTSLFRTQFYTSWLDQPFVVTRRHTIDRPLQDATSASNRFLYRAIPVLAEMRDRLSHPRENGRVVRLYALCEDGMLATLPILPEGDAALRERYWQREGEELRKMPKQPNFVSNEFFFVFDFEPEATRRIFFSGLYLDLGGKGLIATLTTPLHAPDGELKGIVGMDIAFPLDWADFAASIQEPLQMEVVSLEKAPRVEAWQPWQHLLLRMQPSLPREAVARLAAGEQRERRFHNPTPIFHGLAEGLGAVVAFQVDESSWLVILFPDTPPQFPLGSVILLVLLLLVLLFGFEWNRRRAEAAQAQAITEFEEKQNLLDTMRVPLMVVDPNNEQIVYSNRASELLGIKPGGTFRDCLADVPGTLAHYEHMQVAGPAERRAYGLPLKIDGEVRYAVIRSVAVKAPIHMIGADERHRLGILFLVEPETDLHLFTGPLLEQAERDEQRKLSGLLSHGVDTLARILGRRLASGRHDGFTSWLGGYLERRIHVVSWLLDRWSMEPPLPPEVVIDGRAARMTVERLVEVLSEAAQDASLRAQLHWNNGIFAEPCCGSYFQVDIQWPDGWSITSPVRGGLGMFLGEVLINAVRHGKPGTQIKLTVQLDSLAHELRFAVENQMKGSLSESRWARKYGGRGILERLAHLLGWRDLTFEYDAAMFRASWRVPAGEREECGD